MATRQDQGQARAPRGEGRNRAAGATRVPLGVPVRRLQVPERPGYRRRWINDDGSRIQRAQNGGYQFVEDPSLQVGDTGDANTDIGSRVSQIVGRKRDGSPLRAFLMEIESELYQEDQASKQRALDEVDRAIKKGQLRSDGEENRYVPDKGKGIRIRSEGVRLKGEPQSEDAGAE